MEEMRKKIVELKNNCDRLLDIIDNKLQEFESESQQIVEISKLTRKCSVLCYEINKLGVGVCLESMEEKGQNIEKPKKIVNIMDMLFNLMR